MAPKTKTIRTYSRCNNSSVSCMEALDILFAKNKTEKKLAMGQKKIKAKKIQIKELPQMIKNFLSDESSLHVNFDDTFDRLLRGDQCNVIKAKDIPIKKCNTKTFTSKKPPVIEKFAHIHSPIFKKTRSHASSVEISEIKNESKSKNKSNSWFKQKTIDPIDNSLEIDNVVKEQHKKTIGLDQSLRDSPILLRSSKQKEKILDVDRSHNKLNVESNESLLSNHSVKKEQVKTNHSEKPSRLILNGSEQKILIREISIVTNKTQDDVKNKTDNLNPSFDSFFTQSLREKILVHSSTPLVPNIKRNIINQPISPIKTFESMDRTGEPLKSPFRCELVKDAIAESISEIINWNTSFPKIDDKIDDSYHLNLDNFAGSNIQEQLINMGTFLRQKRENLINGKEPFKSRYTDLSNGQSKRTKLLKKLSVSKSYGLEDFEKFHSVMRSSGSSDSNKIFSLKDFETFHKNFSIKNSYITKRKSKVAFREHIKSLHRKFDLKNLFIKLDDVLINKFKETRNTSNADILLKSFTIRQPVVNLTRLSLNNLDRTKEKICLENKLSSNVDRLQDDSLISNVDKVEIKNTCHTCKTSSNNINLDQNDFKTSVLNLKPTSDTEEYIIDLTDDNIENQKENSKFAHNPYVNIKRKQTGKLTKKLQAQSTPLQEKDRNVNRRKSRVNLAEIPWTIDLIMDEETNGLEDETISSNTQMSTGFCPIAANTNSTNEYCIDLTDEDLDPNCTETSSKHSETTSQNDEEYSQTEETTQSLNTLSENCELSSQDDEGDFQYENFLLDGSEDPEKTKLDLEELFGIISPDVSIITNDKVKESNSRTSDFYGFNSISEAVLTASNHSSVPLNDEGEAGCDKTRSLGDIFQRDNFKDIMSVKKIQGQLPEKSRNENKRISLEDILNNMLDDCNTNLSKNVVSRKKSVANNKYRLRSKYDAQEKQNDHKTLDSTLADSRSYFNEMSSNHSLTVDELNASSIFFKSLQLRPNSILNIKNKSYNLRSKYKNDHKEKRSNCSFSNSHSIDDNKKTLPNICDSKNVILSDTNSSLSEFIQIVEEDYDNSQGNKDVQSIEEDNNLQGLAFETTPENLEAQINQNSALHDTSEDNNRHDKTAKENEVRKKNGVQVQDIERLASKQRKLGPARMSKDLIVDLTVRDLNLGILEYFDTSNIVVTDPMEEELEISCSTTKKSLIRTSAEVSASKTTLQKVPINEVSSSSNNVIECSLNSTLLPKSLKETLKLKAGKSWRRSLLTHNRESCLNLCRDINEFGTSSLQNLTSVLRLSQRRQSIRIVPVERNVTSRKTSILQRYALHTVLDESKSSISLETDCSSFKKSVPTVSASEIVLKKCGQTEPLPFTQLYPPSLLKDCKKIGEGVYGEVFLYKWPNGKSTVMKVIPIESSLIINGERQKNFEEILSEIVISSELSKLRSHSSISTPGFCEVQRICCVQGTYPDILLDLWKQYDDEIGSENESPEVFTKNQLYIVLDLANAGQDLEAFVFNNASQACAMFQQVACALACAEEQLKFEHRDLHWGNVMLRQVNKSTKVTCKLRNREIVTQTKGVVATIIDFTLSRMTTDGVVMFNDLSKDPDLFLGEGDYQFEIYRKMRNINGNLWEKFEPYSNILWLHYVLDKSVGALRYKNTTTKIHNTYMEELKKIQRIILDYNSVKEFVSSYYC